MFHVETRGESTSLLAMDDGKVNAIGPDWLDAFDHGWRKATKDHRAVVLAGNGKAFSAGLNLKVLPTLEREDLLAFFRRFIGMCATLYAYPRPVVAAVDGPAMAGGAILNLCGDVRFATPHARIGLTEMPVGIVFPAPVLDLAQAELPHHEIGPAIFEGVVREGEACVARGWSHRMAGRDALIEEALLLADTLAQHNPRAYAVAKAHLRGPVARSLAEFEKRAETYVDDLQHPDTISSIVRYFERVTAKK